MRNDRLSLPIRQEVADVVVASPFHNDSVTIDCPVCHQPFSPQGRARYCSDRCRQAAFRRRHQLTSPEVHVPPKGAKRAVTVYVCDGCGARSLGEQYCAECRTFMRSLGRGGYCLSCEEAIAVSELVELEAHSR